MSYAAAGIDLHRYDSFIDSLDGLMRRTHGPRVVPNPGGFAGLFRLDYNQKLFARNYKDPVLVACSDGVGTKVRLAQHLGVYHTVGIDLVAMNVNDLIVEGAEPLFFLDCLSVHHVEKDRCAAIMHGIVEGCRTAGCALLGGETAEMGDMFRPGEFDLVGFAVGVVDLERAVSRRSPSPGDVVLALGSNGIHSNGYTLVRRVVDHAGLDLTRSYDELRDADHAPTLGEVLLAPTRIYADSIVRLSRAYRVKKVITGMAHITGGGLGDNLERALASDTDAVLDPTAWPVPPIFPFLQRHGSIDDEEMRRVFNMGVGYCVIVRPTFADAVAQRLTRSGERVFRVGKIVKGQGRVRLK